MNELEFVRLGSAIIGSMFIGTGILIWYLDRKHNSKHCKSCGSDKLEHFAGIGADGIMCRECGKIQ